MLKLVITHNFGHHCPILQGFSYSRARTIEYEYEYHFIEYEYDGNQKDMGNDKGA